MARTAVILHGTGGSPDENWFDWLKGQLGWRGYEVWLPQLPDSDHPDIATYWNYVRGYPFDEETLIVGHSSGATAALGILHELPEKQRVDRVVCVAGFVRDEGWNCEGLLIDTYDWPKIRRQANRIDLVWAKDDPVVSEEQTDGLAERLGVKPLVLPEGRHFSAGSGSMYGRRFPPLLDLILQS